MALRLVKSKQNAALRPCWLAAAGLLALIAVADHATAASARSRRVAESAASRTAGPPLMAIVSLRNQRITVYDANGWILRAPVSSGQKGRETPAGVFSIIQKQAEHYSNLYDDAYMPHMQRITWSGIALHGGIVPGYPASHGCIRLPYGFAARLFAATNLGMRVIVAPSEVEPTDISHPALFVKKPAVAAQAAALAAEASEAAKRMDQARLAVFTASREASRATMPVRVAENLKIRAEAQLATAERALAAADSPAAKDEAQDAVTKAAAKAAELQAQWTAAKAELQPKLDAVAAAREAAAAAQAARAAAAQAAQQAARELEPVSAFVSRKTQRLYVRRGFQPVLESPITIVDPDRPIGTHVFTAMDRNDGDLHWTAVSLNSGGAHELASDLPERTRTRHADIAMRSAFDAAQPDPTGAKAALDRIVIPQDVLDRLGAMAWPRSSLIISDEALSSETGNGTEFVVIMSGEPQGSLKMRRRSPSSEFRYLRGYRPQYYWRFPFSGPYTW